MKRLLLVLFAFIFLHKSYAQCTPDAALTHSGLYPTVLADGKVGIAYNQTITFQFPTDTTLNLPIIGLTTVHIDTLIIASVIGFPNNYTHQCNTPGCMYTVSPLRGCMQIIGTPAAADTGTKKLILTILVKFKLAGSNITYPVVDSSQSYRVQSNTGVSRGQAQNFAFGIEQITPNPFTENTAVYITSPKYEKVTLAIRDILGKEVYTQEVNCKTGSNRVSINTEEFKAGYYLLSVTSSSGVITKKITKR